MGYWCKEDIIHVLLEELVRNLTVAFWTIYERSKDGLLSQRNHNFRGANQNKTAKILIKTEFLIQSTKRFLTFGGPFFRPLFSQQIKITSKGNSKRKNHIFCSFQNSLFTSTLN